MKLFQFYQQMKTLFKLVAVRATGLKSSFTFIGSGKGKSSCLQLSKTCIFQAGMSSRFTGKRKKFLSIILLVNNIFSQEPGRGDKFLCTLENFHQEHNYKLFMNRIFSLLLTITTLSIETLGSIQCIIGFHIFSSVGLFYNFY